MLKFLYDFFTYLLTTLYKVLLQKISSKFDFYVQSFIT